MLESIIFLGKLIFGTVALVGGIVLVSFLKNIFESVILPVIEPLIPFLRYALETVLNFVEKTSEVSINFILDCIIYIKDKLLGIVANYNQISHTEIEATHELFVLDENKEIKQITVKTILNKDELPDEIKNDLSKTHYHDKDLLREALLKIKGENYVTV